jgi:hypothetical protein
MYQNMLVDNTFFTDKPLYFVASVAPYLKPA